MSERVLLLGAGGLGSGAALALAVAGVQRLGIVDGDDVALSNLHRQVIYHTYDVGKQKAVTACERLRDRFPFLQTTPYPFRLENIQEMTQLVAEYDLVLDGSDNFATRFAINEAAFRANKPLVHGAAAGYLGQVTTLDGSPCLHCLFTPPSDEAEEGNCMREGVVGPLAGEVGWLMAMEALKLLRGVGEPLRGRLLSIDLLQGKRRVIHYRPDPACPVCGQGGR
ncbi:MAG: HesA/MoeB/ThiF family protein [Magnetococcales bacterium]|nr:HesA/MoeB/ThiF family protein [Magnetococcales bacterium]NGZ28380.1 HesA/MoeB/ThiF family protein [Magnetococcales bacterium]